MPVILPDKAAVEAWLGAALPESCIIQVRPLALQQAKSGQKLL